MRKKEKDHKWGFFGTTWQFSQNLFIFCHTCSHKLIFTSSLFLYASSDDFSCDLLLGFDLFITDSSDAESPWIHQQIFTKYNKFDICGKLNRSDHMYWQDFVKFTVFFSERIHLFKRQIVHVVIYWIGQIKRNYIVPHK